MPAEPTEKDPLTISSQLEATFSRLELQEPAESNTPGPMATVPNVSAADNLTSAKSLQELPAPAKCSSPRISSHSGNCGSHAAMSLLASKSPLAQSKRRISQPAVRRSADAVLVSGSSTASSNPKATAFRQARQRNSMQLNVANSREDSTAAAVRRARVYFCTHTYSTGFCCPKAYGIFSLNADNYTSIS